MYSVESGIKPAEKYFGKPCPKHPESARYKTSHGCVVCAKAKDRKSYYKHHPERLLQSRIKANRYTEENKNAVINVLTNGEGTCRWCGQGDIDVLTVDHVLGGGTRHRNMIKSRNGQSLYSWIIRNDYPDGFQVLCANCNLKKEVMRRRSLRKETR